MTGAGRTRPNGLVVQASGVLTFETFVHFVEIAIPGFATAGTTFTWRRVSDILNSMRWSFIVGGLAGLAIALARFGGGGQSGYDAIGRVNSEISDPVAAAGLAISWHATSVSLLLISVGMVYAAFASRDVKRVCGIAATVLFGAISLLFILQGMERFDGPFALWPVALVLVPALCGAIGAWRA